MFQSKHTNHYHAKQASFDKGSKVASSRLFRVSSEKTLSYHDVIEIVKRNFFGYYAINPFYKNKVNKNIETQFHCDIGVM